MKFTISPSHPFSGVSAWNMISLVIIATTQLVTQSEATTPSKQIRNMKIQELNTPAFRLVINSRNGDILVGSRNLIYKLSKDDLSIIDKVQTGPVNDSFSCRPYPEPCTSRREMKDNDNQVLLINYDTVPEPILITCGTTNQGMCHFHRIGSLQIRYLFGSPDSTSSYISSRRGTVAFFVPRFRSEPSMFIASEYDERPLDFSSPVVSAKTLVLNQGKGSFKYAFLSNITVSSFDYPPNIKLTYRAKYLYGFVHGGYAYLVTVQPIGLRTSKYETRLARVCLRDLSFSSYSEIPMFCQESSKMVYYPHDKLHVEVHLVIQDNMPIGTMIGVIQASIPESRTSALPPFKIMMPANEKYAKFDLTIEPSTGKIRSAIILNRERTSYYCFVAVSSNGFRVGVRINVLAEYNKLSILATTAVLGKVGRKQYQATGASKSSSDALFVAFSTGIRTSINQTDDSVICAFTMDKIEGQFESAVKNCYNGNSRSHLLTAFYGGPKRCTSDSFIKATLCGSSWNPYIEGSVPLIGNCLASVSNENVTSLAVIVQGEETVAVIGTESGLLQKVLMSEDAVKNEQLFAFDFATRGDADRAIRPNPVGDKTYLYFATGNQVVKFPVGSCSIYTDCRSCLTKNDPLNCGWCGTFCAHSLECDKLVNFNMCPPVIDFFTPNKGPRDGGTEVTISGDNFGLISQGDNSRITITVAGIDCEVETWESRQVKCVTKASPSGKREGNVKVSVHDISRRVGNFDIAGDIVSKERFTFLTPSLESIYTSFEQQSGGTRFLLTGYNLDIGHERTILVDNDTCTEVENNGRYVTCLTSRDFDGQSVYRGNVKMEIDGHSIALQATHPSSTFKLDPIIDDFEPEEATVSGGTTIAQSQPSTVTFLSEANDSYYDIIWLTILFVLCVFMASCSFFFAKQRGYFGKKQTATTLQVAYESNLTEPSSLLERLSSDYSASSVIRSDGDVARPLLIGPRNPYLMDEETLATLTGEQKLIAMDLLTMGEMVGKGHFGCVYKASLRLPGQDTSTDVAVKTLQSSWFSYEGMSSFIKEALIMKDFDHEHVLNLIGVCIHPGNKSPFVVVPFMSKGDLSTYIRSVTSDPTLKDLITFGIEIAKGMEYLASQKCVHRDLAARNCMLDENLHVRVADFGLSRDIYERGYYKSDRRTELPVKWMAPESIEKGLYTMKTDVWAYGVTLWELMTRGVPPYPEVNNWDIMSYLSAGRRLLRPECTPEMLYEIMETCWSFDPKERPSFSDLVRDVQNVITTLEENARSRRVGLEVTYVNIPAQG